MDGARRPGALVRAKRIEAFWRREFADREDVRILGTVVAFDLAGDGYLSKRREEVIEIAWRHGVFLRPLGDVVYAMPPLCTSDASLRRIAAALRAIG